LRNFFIIVFRSGGNISDATIEKFISRFPSHLDRETKGGKSLAHGGRLDDLSAYFRKYHALSQQWSEEAHVDWNEVVSNLNAPGDRLPITYRNKGTHNLQGIGIQNMLNLIAHILPDPILETPWPAEKVAQHELVERKLTRLCELVSREGFHLEWNNGGKKIDQDFLTIEFVINGIRSFSWSFNSGHFTINPLINLDERCWFAKIGYKPIDIWADMYLQRCKNDNKESIVIGNPYDIYTYSLTYDGQAIRMVKAIVSRDDPEYFQTLNLIIKKRIPFDVYALDQLSEILLSNERITGDHRFYPLDLFLGKPQVQKDDLLKIAVDRNSFYTVRLLLDHGANANTRDEDGKPILFEAISFNREAIAAMLLRAGADPNARTPAGSSALGLALVFGLENSVKDLVRAGADVHVRLTSGRTLLDVSKEAGKDAITRFLEQALKEAEETKKKSSEAPAGPPPIRSAAAP
jgi:hypothetical protein